MLTEIENFLTKEECEKLVQLIDQNHHRSGVAGEGDELSTYSEHRTSSSSYLDTGDPFIKMIKERIANFLGYESSKGEPLQGQLYEPGQFFKRHNDWFSGDSYKNHCLDSGNRTDTFMIYLNEGMEGGGTDFPLLARNIKPKLGKAVHWRNLYDGKPVQAVEHEGQEVISGKKYIITSWWRERDWAMGADQKLSNATLKVVEEEPKNQWTFSSPEELPNFTDLGFTVMKVPDEAWAKVQSMYAKVKDHAENEDFPHKEDFIQGMNERTSEILNLELVHEERDELHEMLRPLHEEWASTNLEPTFIYGIRSYLRGTGLKCHVDKIESHHISSIIIVDKNLKCGCQHRDEADDWALDIQAHNGEWHKVYAKPGYMILYESAKCMHGREDLFGGTYFRNMFVHYKLKDFVYKRD